MPRGSEFGVDYKSWQTDEKFLGLKMIPPGPHFVYCSIKTAPRIGGQFQEESIAYFVFRLLSCIQIERGAREEVG